MNILNRIRQFMIGRNGIDQLGMAIVFAYFLLSVLSNIFRFRPFIIAAYLLFILWIFRTLSKNIIKRQKENRIFLSYWNPFHNKIKSFKGRWEQRKTYRFYKCPNCRQIIRVPRGKGKICITCPKCRNEFIRKS